MLTPMGRAASHATLLFVYSAALVAAYLTFIAPLPSDSLLVRALLADVVATVVVFLGSRILNNSSVYDPYWSVAPPALGALFLLQASSGNSEALMNAVTFNAVAALLLSFIWGSRLTFSFLRGWPGLSHEDFRYVDLREKHGLLYWLVSFFGIHLFPTLLTFGGSLALYAAIAGAAGLNLLSCLGALIAALAIYLEATADKQLDVFRRGNPKPEEILKTGVWALCRHPNYLGEISFWWGLFLIGVGSAPHLWWTVIGPLSINLLFVFISLPMIDERMLKKRPHYQTRIDEIPALLPLGSKKR